MFNRLNKFCLAISLLTLLFANQLFANTDPTYAALFIAGSKPPVGTVLGNPQGDVTLIEFSDYNCHYCRLMNPVMNKTLANDKQLRVVMIEYPVITDSSVDAARAAISARLQGKYLAFHNALINYPGTANSVAILKVANKTGMDINRLLQQMKDPTVNKELDTIMRLGNDLGLPGTPTFIIGKTLKHPTNTSLAQPVVNFGYVDYNSLKAAINTTRKQ